MRGTPLASRFMTELSTNLFITGGQMLLDERERAFIAECDTICLIAEGADGWPGVQVLDPTRAALEIVNAQALRIRLEKRLAAEVAKIALLLIRRSDGQHLIIHGHVAARSHAGDEDARIRIAVASRAWSPETPSPIDPALSRALRFC